MVVCVEHVNLCDVSFCKLQIAFAKVTAARAGGVLAELITVSLSVLVFDKFSDASVSMGSSSTFLAIFVSFAHSIKSIYWWAVTGVRHWSVTKNETVASVSPVFALVELRVVMLHHVGELIVPTLLVRTGLSNLSVQQWLSRSRGKERKNSGGVFHFVTLKI